MKLVESRDKDYEREKPDMLEFKKEKYKVYLEERKYLSAGELEGYKSFDKAILTISAGLIAITFSAFKDNLLSEYSAILKGAWGLFLLSMVLTLTSLLISPFAFARGKDILEEWYLGEKLSNNRYNSIVKCLNISSFAIILIGLICLSFYILLKYGQ